MKGSRRRKKLRTKKIVALSIENITASVTYYFDNDTTDKSSERKFFHDMASVLEKVKDSHICKTYS